MFRTEIAPIFNRPHIEDARMSDARLGIGAPREFEVLFVTDLNHPRRMEMLGELLLERGHSEMRVEKIIGGNFARLFTDVWM